MEIIKIYEEPLLIDCHEFEYVSENITERTAKKGIKSYLNYHGIDSYLDTIEVMIDKINNVSMLILQKQEKAMNAQASGN